MQKQAQVQRQEEPAYSQMKRAMRQTALPPLPFMDLCLGLTFVVSLCPGILSVLSYGVGVEVGFEFGVRAASAATTGTDNNTTTSTIEATGNSNGSGSDNGDNTDYVDYNSDDSDDNSHGSPLDNDSQLDPEHIFQTARHAYTFGDYPMALKYLNRILYPRVLLTDEEEINEALEILGITAYYENHPQMSRQAFVRLLSADPDHRLDPLVVPPQIVDFFDGIRQELDENLKEIRERRHRQEQWEEMEQLKARQTLVLEQRITMRPTIMDLLPFGIAQFSQERPAWGTFFLSTQLLSLGLNMGSYLAVENMRNENGFHVSSDIEQAEYLQNIQIVSLVGLGAMLVWGTMDGLINKQPPREEIRSYSLPAGQLPPGFANAGSNETTTTPSP